LDVRRPWVIGALFFGWNGGAPVAKKGDLHGIRHVNIVLDQVTTDALEQVAARDERRLTEQVRFYIRKGLKADLTPVGDEAGVA
jgi:hypothetical protein